MPVTTVRPRQAVISLTARMNPSSSRPETASSASRSLLSALVAASNATSRKLSGLAALLVPSTFELIGRPSCNRFRDDGKTVECILSPCQDRNPRSALRGFVTGALVLAEARLDARRGVGSLGPAQRCPGHPERGGACVVGAKRREWALFPNSGRPPMALARSGAGRQPRPRLGECAVRVGAGDWCPRSDANAPRLAGLASRWAGVRLAAAPTTVELVSFRRGFSASSRGDTR